MARQRPARDGVRNGALVVVLGCLGMSSPARAAEPTDPPPEPPAEPIDVVVTGSREAEDPFLADRSVTAVGPKALAEKQPRTTPEALWDSPGVFVQQTSHGGGSPIVRGLVGPQVLLLIDGVRLNSFTDIHACMGRGMSRLEHACALLALSLAVSPVVAADEPEAKPPAADSEAGTPAAKPEAGPPASSASAPPATETTPPAEGAAAAPTLATSAEESVSAPPPAEGAATAPPPEHGPSSELLPRSDLPCAASQECIDEGRCTEHDGSCVVVTEPASGSSHLLVTGIAMLAVGTVVTVTAAVETANAGTLQNDGMETAGLVVLAAGGTLLIAGIPVTLAGYSVSTSEVASAWAPTVAVGPTSCDLLWSF